MQQSNDYVDDPLVAYKAGLAAALSCLLTAEEGERIRGSDSGAAAVPAAAAPDVVELLASTLRLHLRKQQAFNEYYSFQKQITSARLVTVNSRDNDDLQTTLTTTNTAAAAIQTVTDDDEDSIRRRQLLMECFQGVNLHYYSSSVHQTIAPPSSPEPNTNQVGPSL